MSLLEANTTADARLGMRQRAEHLRRLVAAASGEVVQRVKSYMPAWVDPSVFVVAGDDAYPDSLGKLPDWVRAVTQRDMVLLFAERGPWLPGEVSRILCHELFHAATWTFLAQQAALPWWFNEAAADWVSTREFGVVARVDGVAQNAPSRRIQAGVIAEPSPLVRDFTAYLLGNFPPQAMQRFLQTVKASGDFEQAAAQVFDLWRFEDQRSHG